MSNVSIALAFTLAAIGYLGKGDFRLAAPFAPPLVCFLATAIKAVAARRLLFSALPPRTADLHAYVMHPDGTEAGALVLLAQGTSAAANAALAACEQKADNIRSAERWTAVGLILLIAAVGTDVGLSLVSAR